MTYVPLWCKSNFSFLTAASHPEELVQQAAELGLPALALTDCDGVYGVVRAHLEAKKRDIKLIVGSQISEENGSRIVLLAQNRCGYRNLCRLISCGRMRSPKGESRVSFGEICAAAEGLVAIWADGLPETAAQDVHRLRQGFGPRLYAAVARHRREGEGARERQIRSAAARYGLPTVAAPEVLYHQRERKPLFDVMRCIDLGITVQDAGTRLAPNAEHSLKSGTEIDALYADCSEDVQKTVQIADSCRFSLDELTYRYPLEQVPEGYSTDQWLTELVRRGARERYRGTVPPDVATQLRKELEVITDLDYCGYFLTMHEIVTYCRRNGILCQGRGSAANSAVCYCLGITAIDPVRMELLFERFISRERAEPPDIDLDIEHNRREEVIQHMYQTYGRERAAMVANVVRYRPKSALREVGKAIGLPSTELDRIARVLSHYSADFAAAFTMLNLDPQAPMHAHLIALTRELLDTPRHLSIHPGGFLLGSEPVIDLVPVENATMENRTVIQWDKYDVEALGLFKVDLLGLGALTHLDYCFQLLQRHYGADLSMARIPASDPEVFAMLSQGDTVGVFQVESRAQMAMLPRLQPRSFYDLVIEISIVRPGPISGGMVHPYLRRRNGEEEVCYPHPDLEPVLRKTLGVPLFQEQVMKLAVIAADYTPGEADQLRRDMAAWRRSGAIEKHGQTIIERMTSKGIEREFAQAVFDQIRGFGEYGFPESHAASFALIAWCTAWMRRHYPAVFACALLNAWPMGFYSPATIVEDAKRRGVAVLPVDVFKSDWDCTLEGERHALRMGLRYVKGLSEQAWRKIQALRSETARQGANGPNGRSVPSGTNASGTRGSGVRSGGSSSGSGDGSRDRITGGEITSVAQFARCSGLDEKSLAALAHSGALEVFGSARRDALWDVIQKRPHRQGSYNHNGRGNRNQRRDRNNRDNRYGSGNQREGFVLEDLLAAEQRTPGFRPLNEAELIRWNYQATRHSVDGHPIAPYRSLLSEQSLPSAAELQQYASGSSASFAGMVICRQRPGTAGGTLFLTMEDETGFLNVIVWKHYFRANRVLLLTRQILGVSGTVQVQSGVLHLVLRSCWIPALPESPAVIPSRDFH